MQYSSLIKIFDSHPQQSHLDNNYDLVIIGAGISSAFTLIHYINELETQAVERFESNPIKIAVTEKSGEFWTGMPYGSRSGCNSLLITNLKEFIPQTEERQKFIDWLVANRDRIFAPEKFASGELSRKWLQDNQADMDRNLWDELFLPRHTFGIYITERIDEILQSATAKGLIDIDLFAVDVLDVRYIQDLYHVDFVPSERVDRTGLVAKQLVLAIGSPPNIAFDNTAVETGTAEVCYIDNMYEPSMDANIDRICTTLAATDARAERQVLIVGSNASTLDILYGIANSKTATDLIDKFIILSPSATFPHRINREVPQLEYTPTYLTALVNSPEPFTAKQILEAVQQDVEAATAVGINISDIYTDISKVVIQCLNLLSFAQQKQFVSRYAVEIGKLQRRAGGEYLDVVDGLIAQNKLTFLKGKFVKYLPFFAHNSGCEYIDSSDGTSKTFSAPIRVVINCAGFQDVTRSSSPLIQNLLRRGICQPNESNRGFVMNKNFAANTNCYLMGPLIAGNIDGDFRVWHAESCQRIIGLSQSLARVLVSSKCQEDVATHDLTPTIAVPDPEPVGVMINAAA